MVVIATNSIAMNKIKANIEIASIKMSKIVMNKTSGHLINEQIVSFNRAQVLSDVT